MVTGGRFHLGNFRRVAPAVQVPLESPALYQGQPWSEVEEQHRRSNLGTDPLSGLNTGLQPESIIPEYLVPVGESGLYVSPNEPVDPWDCDRYPNSPYCGSPGVDPIAFGSLSPLSVYPRIQATPDRSEVCIDVGASVFGVALAPFQACYRAPWAQPRRSPPRPAILGEGDPWYPLDLPDPLPGEMECYFSIEIGQPVLAAPETPDPNDPGYYNGNMYVFTEGGLRGVPIGYTYWKINPSLPLTSGNSTLVLICQTTSAYSAHPGGVIYRTVYPSPGRGTIDFLVPLGNLTRESCPPEPRTPYRFPGADAPPYRPNPDPPDDPMVCNCAEIEEMLRILMLRLGTTSYPVTTPTWLMGSDQSSASHESLTQLTAWFIKQLDGLAGQFPIEVEIEDIDPTQSGNQTERVKLENIAETLAELYGLGVKSSVNGDIAINFLMRLAAEVIATKNASVVTQDYARANAAFLGYRANPKERTIDYAFDPEQLDNLEGILSTSRKKIIGWQLDDPETVVEFLQKIVFSSGLIKAVFMRRRDDVEDIVNQIRNLTDPDSDEAEAQNENWNDFIQELNNALSRFNSNSPIRPNIEDISSQIDNLNQNDGGVNG